MSEIPNHQSAESTRNDPRPTTTHPFTLAKLKSTSTAPTSNLAKSVLDLAYGTGLVTILAKQQVGETGNVIGIDISQGMLDVARAKTKQLGLDITLFEHNITDLDELRLDMKFDIITCASALWLLKEPLPALKHWARVAEANDGETADGCHD